ncbi:sensor domain-containing diguanylate cyclase [Modicisalibacter sp. 'Wilcox']|uniref:sensor domain-containing diguanylate cyclase n=1 Tax=Modicisalibacter sp. 'Wilcox' TaxID=2679914 RepID=UPI0013D22054|nr:sensor domain-containing diguanylate cyclase [Modicisalibacter sp. 'Wilcox']
MLPISASSRHPRQALARRLYPARVVGLALGMVAVAAAWQAAPPAWPWWVLLGLNGLGWPHLARYLATRVRDPHRTERHCLLIDGLLTGFWVAAVDFAPIPGAALIALYNLGTLAVGGPRLLAAGALAWLAGGGVGALIWPTPDWQLLPAPLALLGALPLLLLYPLMIGWRSYHQACQLVEQKRRETRQRRTDALTGLYNRAHWERVIESHFDGGRPPLCLALLEIDHFQRINDTFGHAMGDQVLRRTARFLQETLGEEALLARHGATTFGLLLAETPLDRALTQLDGLRAAFLEPEVQGESLLPCTLSIGLAECHTTLNRPGEWLQQAELALDSARVQGRNRVVAYSGTARSA